MSFLSRWDDTTAPSVRDAARDALVRAVLPALPLFAAIVAVGLVIVGPLRSMEVENDINRWFQERRTPTGEAITLVMSSLGNTEYVIGLAVLVTGVVWWRTRRWWYALLPLLAISLQASIFVVSAWIVGRSRPNVERLDPTPPTASYPSGHVGASTALYAALALMATRIERVWLRRVVIVLCVLAPLSVAFARVYRGAHHPSDVVAGIVNGSVCALLAWRYLRRDPSA